MPADPVRRLRAQCLALPGTSERSSHGEPGRGWVGVRLEAEGLAEPDWDEIGEIVRDAYRMVAPKTLVGRLDD